jgi:hypothetical protein
MRTVIVVLLILPSLVAVSAQEVPQWKLVEVPTGSMELSTSVAEYTNQGYVPAGIEMTADASTVILFAQIDVGYTGEGKVETYTDWNLLQELVQTELESGLVPMDVSRHDGSLSVLWTRNDIEVEGWRLQTAPNTASDRSRIAGLYRAQGYSLWGLSIHDGLAWCLFLQVDAPIGAILLLEFEVADPTELSLALQETVGAGWMPFAIAQSEGHWHVALQQ